MEDRPISLFVDTHHCKHEHGKLHTFLDDYSHLNREFEYFHPKHDEECCDECEFCHCDQEPSVLDAIHADSAAESNARGFACVVGFLFGVR